MIARSFMRANAPSKILLRTSRELHRRLLSDAKLKKQSLNELCLERLSIPSSLEGQSAEVARKVVGTADHLFKENLRGVIFYGSQARKEARTDSDWDFLVIIDDTIKLTRDLYRRWDDFWSATPHDKTEIHFAHKPKSTGVSTGFWCEIALDGIVLFEKEFSVSSHLVRIRREIADGMIMRQNVHGQSYWIRKEIA